MPGHRAADEDRAVTRRSGVAGPVVAAALLVLGILTAWVPTGAASSVRPERDVSARVEPMSTSFVSATEGAVLGAVPCGSTTCTALATTSDGGRRWASVPAPPAPLAGPPTGAAAVPSDAVGTILLTRTRSYAYGPGLWVAATPGRWVALHPGGPVLDLAVDAGTVWAVVASCWSQDPGCLTPSLRLARARVGTDAWQAVPGLFGFDDAQLLFRGGNGWVAMWPRRLPSPVTIWRTTDAGASWRRIPDPCYQPSEAIDLAALASPGGSTLFELCAGNPGAGQEMKQLLESTDGGTAARPVAAGPLEGLVAGLAAPSPSLLVLAASSGAGFLDRSADGGAHWKVTTLDDGGVGLSGLSFVSPSVGVVVDGHPTAEPWPDRLLMTRDGGLTWSVVPVSTASAPLSAGRVGPGAVWRDATKGGQVGVFQTCFAATAPASVVRACIARYMAAHGASAAAIAFFEATQTYLIRFLDTGRVDIGYTLSELPMDCGCVDWILLNGRPADMRPKAPSLTTPVYAPLQRAYRLASGYRPGFDPLLVLQPPDLEAARTLPGGTEELWVQFPLNDACNACATPYRARAFYRLSPAGDLTSVVSLGPCLTTVPQGSAASKVHVAEPACPPVASNDAAADEQIALTALCGPKRPIPTIGDQPACGDFPTRAETPDGRHGTLYAIQLWAAPTSDSAKPIFFFDGRRLLTENAALAPGVDRYDVLLGEAGTARFAVSYVAFKLRPPPAPQVCAHAVASVTLRWVYAFNGREMTVAPGTEPPHGYTFHCT